MSEPIMDLYNRELTTSLARLPKAGYDLFKLISQERSSEFYFFECHCNNALVYRFCR